MKLSNKDDIQYMLTVDSLPDHFNSGVKKDGGFGDVVKAALPLYFYESEFNNIGNAAVIASSTARFANKGGRPIAEHPETATGIYWSAMVKQGYVVPRYIQTDDRLCSDNWAEVYAKYDIKALSATFGRDTITDARNILTINEFELRCGLVA